MKVLLALVVLVAVSMVLGKPLAFKEDLPYTYEDPLGSITWDFNCSKPADPLKVLNLTITPKNPKKGDEVKIYAKIKLQEEVTGGNITVKVSSFPISITKDLCTVLSKAQIKCPVKADTYTFELSFTIPSFLPVSSAKGKVMVKDQNNKELLCADFSASL